MILIEKNKRIPAMVLNRVLARHRIELGSVSIRSEVETGLLNP